MNIADAIDKACADVGIQPPKSYRVGQWAKTDTLSGKNGKGDGRVIVNDNSATAFNWQTSTRSTVFLDGATEVDRKKLAADIERGKEKARAMAARAASSAEALLSIAVSSTHLYLLSKGFGDEKTLVVSANNVRAIAGEYLVPGGIAANAILIPARRGNKVTSAQLIWEDGTKKFLYGGEIGGACHRIATGVDTWLCEGYATGLSVRAALRGLKMRATVLCCFSASNIVAVARQVQGRVFIATDNDKPQPQFNGAGTGEWFARQTGLPYGMPPELQTDFNDMHQSAGIFAVQRVLTSIMARRRAT